MKIYMARIDQSEHQDGTIILDARDGQPVEMAFVHGLPAWLWRKTGDWGGSFHYVEGRYLPHHRIAGRDGDNPLKATDINCFEVSEDELRSMFYAEMGKFLLRTVDEEMDV